jgi:hypothetical protein
MEAGRSRADLMNELTEKMLAFRSEYREREENLMIDALGILSGWISPHLSIQDPTERPEIPNT